MNCRHLFPVLVLVMATVPAVVWGGNLTCHPLSGDYNTGSTTFTEKTRTSEIAAWGDEDGWIKFDLSAVPDGETILALHLNFYVSDTDGICRWAATPVSVDPVTAAADLLSWDINSEAFWESYAWPYHDDLTQGWQEVQLNNQAVHDLTACLEQDWFVVGIRRDSDYLVMEGWNEDHPPYLELVFYTPGPFYVDDDAPGDPGPGDPNVSDPLEDGSPEHPFDAIQEAIDAAPWSGSEQATIWVADGYYQGVGNRDIDFNGKAALLRSVNGPANCIIDAGASESVHTRCFIFHSGEGPDAEIRGFTITGGWHGDGGGIFCENDTMPVIRGNIVTGNKAGFPYGDGGGIYAPGPALIIDNQVTDNQIESTGHGAGIFAGGETTIVNNVVSGNRFLGGVSQGAGIYGGGLISGNLIEDNHLLDTGMSSGVGGGIYVHGSNDLVIGNTIRNNSSAGGGGGIYCRSPNPSAGGTLVTGNLISGNSAGVEGGGIHTNYLDTITNNQILENSAPSGGGIAINQKALVANNLIQGNHAETVGGGIWCRSVFQVGSELINNTVTGNSAGSGGGLYCGVIQGEATITNSIFWGNSAALGKEICVEGDQYPGSVTISYSDVEGGQTSVHLGPGSTLDWGEGMLDTDPLFTIGPQGEFYLSQLVAGQPEESPLVDAGSDWAELICYPVDLVLVGVPEIECLDTFTTRTDLAWDEGMADLGFHYRPDLGGQGVLVVGPGAGEENPPLVRIFTPGEDGWQLDEFMAYGSRRWGVNVACGRLAGLEGDGILTGPGPGPIYGPQVRGFGLDGTPLAGLSFFAYGTQKFGVNVAAGDLNGDGLDEIIAGAGPGAVFGPHVRGFGYDGSVVEPLSTVSFFAYGTEKYGVNVAAGDLDGDGYDEIVTGAGPGAVFGPHVRGWDVDGGPATPISSLSFFAYGTLKYGVNVACGDIDSDGMAEIITSPGPSGTFSAHVRGWNHDGSTVSQLTGVNFIAWPTDTCRYGARVSCADLDGDGHDELLVGQGPDPAAASELKVFRYRLGSLDLWFTRTAFDGDLTHGVIPAGGRLGQMR